MGLNQWPRAEMSQKRSTILTLRLFLRRFVLMKCLGAGALRGREKLSAADFLESELVKTGFKTVDLSSGFVTSEGGICQVISRAKISIWKRRFWKGASKLSRKRILASVAILTSIKIRLAGITISKTVCWELSKLGLCPTCQRLVDKFLQSEFRSLATARERESVGKRLGKSGEVSGRGL